MPAASTPLRETLLRASLWLLLGGWVGSWIFFAGVIARTAFEVLPSTELAGRVVAPALTVLHLYGAVAGALVALVAQKLRRSRALVVLPLALAGLCGYSQVAITGEMERIRPQVFGSGGDEESAARYRALHGRSMAIFGAVALGAIALVFLHARADAAAAEFSAAPRKS